MPIKAVAIEFVGSSRRDSCNDAKFPSQMEGLSPLSRASTSSNQDINDIDSERSEAGGIEDTTDLSEYSIDFPCNDCLLGDNNVAFTALSCNKSYAFWAAILADDNILVSLSSDDTSPASFFAKISHTSPLSGFRWTLFLA
eukprot:CAMPEP_0184421770 /NCGR_PEP_ID=MMETSP0738-20130409/67889_1 /TAXON_ID=385413 /ORGANISM="Thalassiosira miniscula, Strain CCMP1093" /LENGTH=140 /DNA_ID=CAMNT_0026783215 /DNA_START=55 /DNA_END=473 /DNA_ORIENTATION=+